MNSTFTKYLSVANLHTNPAQELNDNMCPAIAKALRKYAPLTCQIEGVATPVRSQNFLSEAIAEDMSEILAEDRSRHPSIWQVKGVSLLLI